MIDADIVRYIRSEIARQVNIILNGSASPGKDDTTETIRDLYPGMPAIENRPIMRPYGLHSIAPEATLSVTARVGDHPGARMVLGHRAATLPAGLSEGETAIFSRSGYEVRVKDGVLEIGKGGTFEPMVLGNKLETVLSAILNALTLHTHPAPGAPPSNAATFSSIDSDQVSGGKLLTKDGGAF